MYLVLQLKKRNTIAIHSLNCILLHLLDVEIYLLILFYFLVYILYCMMKVFDPFCASVLFVMEGNV